MRKLYKIAGLTLFIAAIAPMPKTFSQEKEVITKHVIVGLEKKTVENYGGFDECKMMLEKQFIEVDFRLNNPDVFDFKIKSVIDTVFIFEGPMDSLARELPTRKYDIRIFYDAYTGGGGGWRGAPYFTVTHKWAHDRDKGPFEGDATYGIAHEYGHTMGMYDLYTLEIRPGFENNPVNGEAYKPIYSIMNICYKNKFWDELSVRIMNNNRYGQKVGGGFESPGFPEKMGIKVVDGNGKGVNGASFKLYPSTRNRILAEPRITNKTARNGEFTFSSNPFAGDRATASRLFLLEVDYKNKKYYTWMPINEPHLQSLKHPGEPLYWEVVVE